MIPLLRTLVRPYRANLFFILLAMLVQTAMSLAAPWPLKIVLDNIVGSHKLPSWLDDVLKPVLAGVNWRLKSTKMKWYRLHDIVHRDWENSRPLDLSYEGLLADLQDAEEAESLGLSADRGRQARKRTQELARPTGGALETHEWKRQFWLAFPVHKRRCERNCSRAFVRSGGPPHLVDLLCRAA